MIQTLEQTVPQRRTVSASAEEPEGGSKIFGPGLIQRLMFGEPGRRAFPKMPREAARESGLTPETTRACNLLDARSAQEMARRQRHPRLRQIADG